MRRRVTLSLSLALLGALGLAVVDVRDAAACGGCFVPPTERTQVTDHRMAFSISKQQTVLWDQITYSGNPRDFAWVLPVRAGTTVELSRDQWFAALDASTQPSIRAPNTYGGSFGCGVTGCGQSEATSALASDGANGGVQVISQSVVGPYETVTLRSTDPKALSVWLKDHDYSIPPAIQPTIDAYVSERFDFIALRLRPDCNTRSMQPVRVVSPGADSTLPLRMVAAGVGANVGITLYVIGEGRYRPKAPFVEVPIDYEALVWDRFQNKSNYDALSQQAMQSNEGRGWITEYADNPQISDPAFGGTRQSFAGRTPGLWQSYTGLCRSGASPSPATSPTAVPSSQVQEPCPDTPDAGIRTATDSGVDAAKVDSGVADAGADPDASTDPDASADDGGALDAGAAAKDAGVDSGAKKDAGSSSSSAVSRCEGFDDLDLATAGMNPKDVWLTRLRAQLPAQILQLGDLKLEAHPSQTFVANEHQAVRFSDEKRSGSRASISGQAHEAYGTWALVGVGFVAVTALLRRRRKG